jgi:hypothetical protein
MNRRFTVTPSHWWAKGDLNPSLTRQDTGSPADSLRFVATQSRSLPAVSLSGLDGVKTDHAYVSPRYAAFS